MMIHSGFATSQRVPLTLDVLLLLLMAMPLDAQQSPPQAPLERLRTNIERITNSVKAQWGIYITCLETGEEIAINADETMDTMSVIKIPLMVEVFRQIEAGRFSLDDRYTELRTSGPAPGSSRAWTMEER